MKIFGDFENFRDFKFDMGIIGIIDYKIEIIIFLNIEFNVLKIFSCDSIC